MKPSSFLGRIIFSPWFLAVLPSAVVVPLIPTISSRYDLSEEVEFLSGQTVSFHDLNGDGDTERIMSGNDRPFNRIIVMDHRMRYHDQLNFQDNFVAGISTPFFGNFDYDLYSEIYFFLVHEDSVFLFVNEFFDKQGTNLERRFVTTLGLVNGEIVSNDLSSIGFFDKDNDGKSELFFRITSGYGLAPRNLYSYNLVSDQLSVSPFTGVNMINARMVDLDGDDRPEIIGTTVASGNYHTPTPYSDYSAWVMVYDDQFQFKFPPVGFNGFAKTVYTDRFRDAGSVSLVVALKQFGADTLTKPAVMLYSPRGNLIRERLLDDIAPGLEEFEMCVLTHQENDQIVLTGHDLTILDSRLQPEESIPLPFTKRFYAKLADISGDGENDLLLYSAEEQLLVAYAGDLTYLAALKVHLAEPDWVVSTYRQAGLQKLFIQSGSQGHFLSLNSNPYYFLSYLVYPSVYFSFLLFILVVRRVTAQQIARKEELKKRLLTMQLQNIKGQLDPHFTFNALNSVASMVYAGEREVAYDSMTKFTKLLRQMVTDAGKVYRPLREELDFVRMYLDLEKLRFADRLKFEILVGAGVTGNESVPTMVLQTFVENAVKHGIMPRSEGGTVIIRISRDDGYLRLSIEDNGIGRKNSSDNKVSTGKGLMITREFYDVLNQINPRSVRHQIIDLSDAQGGPCGTRVEVDVRIGDEG